MKCTICDTEIRGCYLIDAWQQPICASHKVEYCFSCGRFVKPSDLHIVDGRCLCSFCYPSIVALPKHIEWVEKRVRSVLSSQGIADIPQSFPIQLVSPSDMSKLTQSKQINLCQPGLTQTIQMIGLGGARINHYIYIFDYLPKIQFAGVLAHEMLHVWQNEKGISLPSPLTEGFCNVGSYVLYQSINTDISHHFIKKLEENHDSVYGDGFRQVVDIYKKTGNLKLTMEYIKKIHECLKKP